MNSIFSDAFINNENLQLLELFSNILRNVNLLIIPASLRELNLGSNSIGSLLEIRPHKKPTHLHTIILRHNTLERLPGGLEDFNETLNSISIYGNLIDRVYFEEVRYLTLLTILQISENPLRFVVKCPPTMHRNKPGFTHMGALKSKKQICLIIMKIHII